MLISMHFSAQYRAQFIDDFSKGVIPDKSAINGWNFYTGSGHAKIEFYQKSDSTAEIFLDASEDTMNVWWGIIRRKVSKNMDLSKINDPMYELRAEARIKSSSAPRRVNLHFNTQRTKDFHSHLREYDIPDKNNWHLISMTTQNFDARPGDDVFVQLALMDWGLKKYYVEIDYIKADVVNINEVKKDFGNPQMYHPPVEHTFNYKNHLTVSENAVISNEFKDLNFWKWHHISEKDTAKALSLGTDKIIILKWDFSNYDQKTASGPGILEIWGKSVTKLTGNVKDFGLIRVCEILKGDTDWDPEKVTFNSFLNGVSFDNVVNPQPIIDIDITISPEPNLISISQAVLNRLLSGETSGIALITLGAIEALIFTNYEPDQSLHPKLHFNLIK